MESGIEHPDTFPEEKFKKWYGKQLDKGKDPLMTLYQQAELADFKEKYDVDMRSPLVCPVCTFGFNIGKLWYKAEDPGKYTCRLCKMVFIIEPVAMTTTELFAKLAQEKKEEREKRKKEKEGDK